MQASCQAETVTDDHIVATGARIQNKMKRGRTTTAEKGDTRTNQFVTASSNHVIQNETRDPINTTQTKL